jgi:hypothetical protein
MTKPKPFKERDAWAIVDAKGDCDHWTGQHTIYTDKSIAEEVLDEHYNRKHGWRIQRVRIVAVAAESEQVKA